MRRYGTIEPASTASGEAARGYGGPDLGEQRDRRSLASEADLSDALFAMVRVAAALSGAEMAFVTLLDAAKEDLRVVASYGLRPPMLGTRLDVPGSFSGQVVISRRNVRTADVRRDRRSFVQNLDHRSGSRAILAVPVWTRREVIGTLVVASRAPQKFSVRCEGLLADIARSVSFALQSQESGRHREAREAGEAASSRDVHPVRSSAQSFGSGSFSDRKSPSAGLFTRRQREIVRLLVGGASCKQIAAALEMSSRTVEHHVERLKLRFRQPTLHGLVSQIVSRKVGDL